MARRSAASTVLVKSIAIVIGPTPPGTGEIQLATCLTLLKSTLPKGECGPACAAGLGIVDEDFPEASKGVPAIELVNLRSQPVGRCVLR